MIELYETDIKDDGMSSSKGNQLKWKKNGVWYKKDNMGYEGLCEYVISHLLLFSNLDRDAFVLYETEIIKFQDKTFKGCKSNNFLKENEELITLERLYKNVYNRSLYIDIFKITDVDERAKYLVEFIKVYIDKNVFLSFFHNMLVVDMFFKNEDRHMNNIGLIRNNKGKYRMCPIFDDGASLGSDITLFHDLKDDPISTYERIKSKTLSFDFEIQEEAVDRLIKDKNELRFNFKMSDLIKILDEEPYYDNIIKNRVFQMIKESMSRYRYLFISDPFDTYLEIYK